MSIEKEENLGPIPFRFNPLWMEDPKFFPLVSRSWSQWIIGSHVHIWVQKLKITKVALKLWAKKSSHSPTVEVEDNQRQLSDIQEKMENNEVTLDLMQKETNVYQKYIKALKREEEMWRIKSKSLWLQAGDKNTNFFHKHAKARQWRNRVEGITTQRGEVLTTMEAIK